MIRRLLIIVLVGAALCAGVYYAPALFVRKNPDDPTAHLETGGTSVVAFMMDQWESVYRKQKKVKVNYVSTGSTEGVTRMLQKKVAVGFTHAPLTEEQKQQAQKNGSEVLHIPVVLCAVVPFYNVAELRDKKDKKVPALNFDGEVLADIFLGKIVKWNDPALQKLNVGVQLPDKPIKVVHRKDSSGTTLIFAEYLHSVSPRWREEMGKPQSKLEWKVGEGIERNKGVAQHIAMTDGTIGYVDLLYAKSASYGPEGREPGTYGAVLNKDKHFIHAEPDNITAAAQGLVAGMADDLTFELIDKPGKDVYPISGAVWAVCYRKQPAEQQKMVADFLRWVTHDGQEHAAHRTYAPLPKELIARIDDKLKLMDAK
jgi:phosphate transport system substrate-binding protein